MNATFWDGYEHVPVGLRYLLDLVVQSQSGHTPSSHLVFAFDNLHDLLLSLLNELSVEALNPTKRQHYRDGLKAIKKNDIAASNLYPHEIQILISQLSTDSSFGDLKSAANNLLYKTRGQQYFFATYEYVRCCIFENNNTAFSEQFVYGCKSLLNELYNNGVDSSYVYNHFRKLFFKKAYLFGKDEVYFAALAYFRENGLLGSSDDPETIARLICLCPLVVRFGVIKHFWSTERGKHKQVFQVKGVKSELSEISLSSVLLYNPRITQKIKDPSKLFPDSERFDDISDMPFLNAVVENDNIDGIQRILDAHQKVDRIIALISLISNKQYHINADLDKVLSVDGDWNIFSETTLGSRLPNNKGYHRHAVHLSEDGFVLQQLRKSVLRIETIPHLAGAIEWFRNGQNSESRHNPEVSFLAYWIAFESLFKRSEEDYIRSEVLLERQFKVTTFLLLKNMAKSIVDFLMYLTDENRNRHDVLIISSARKQQLEAFCAGEAVNREVFLDMANECADSIRSLPVQMQIRSWIDAISDANGGALYTNGILDDCRRGIGEVFMARNRIMHHAASGVRNRYFYNGFMRRLARIALLAALPAVEGEPELPVDRFDAYYAEMAVCIAASKSGRFDLWSLQANSRS